MSDLKTALILDSRIENLTDVESFGVKSSGQNITFQQYAALSASSSLITYQLQIPSEQICVDRHFIQQSTLTFQINMSSINLANGTTANIPVGANVFNWGNTEAWAPFPLTQCFSTMQSTINNCSVSINIGDILPQFLRMTSQEALQKYNSGTPSLVDDRWGMYSNAASNYNGAPPATAVYTTPSNCNPLGGMDSSSYDNSYSPRGAFPTLVSVYQYDAGGNFISNSSICATAGNTFKVVVQATFSEPLLLSPFLNCSPHGNQAGFLGLNTLTLNLNINSLNRVLRTAQSVPLNAGGLVPLYNWQLKGGCDTFVGAQPLSATQLFTNTRLLCQFLTLQPSQVARIALRNVCEFTDYPRFITAFNGALAYPAADYPNTASIPALVSQVITSNNIQLNQIPSRFIICVQVPPTEQNSAYTDSFLSIKNISINFNNKSGILASAQQIDLWKLSVKAGSTQSFAEFIGYQNTLITTYGVATATQTVPVSYSTKYVSTTGSIFVLDAVDLGLEDYLSSGSLGQYNLQMNVTCYNQFPYIVVKPQLTIIACNEGIFSTIAGSSSIMTGLLTKEKVLSTKEQEPAVDSESFKRFVGGVMSNESMANAIPLIGKHYKKLSSGLAHSIVGSGASGGGFSGGGASGGRRHLSKHFI